MHLPTLLLLLTALPLTTALPHHTTHNNLKRHTRHTHISTTGLQTHAHPNTNTKAFLEVAHTNQQAQHSESQDEELFMEGDDGDEEEKELGFKFKRRDVQVVVKRVVKRVQVREVGVWERMVRAVGWRA